MNDPVSIEIESATSSVETTEQFYYRVDYNEKNTQLNRILLMERPESCMIFCNTRARVDQVQKYLARKGYACMALHGDMVQRDVVQTSVSFSDHRAHICGRDESRLRRVVGTQAFEYLLAQALAEIGEERVERQELEGNRALIRARLRLLQQQGPGLGSMFGAPPAARSEQARLETELLENERQLAAIGGSESALEAEFACLTEVLGHPERYLHVEQKQLRLNTMNVVADKASTDPAAEVDFAIANLAGAQAVRRAFVVASVARGEVPSTPKINFDDAARLL